MKQYIVYEEGEGWLVLQDGKVRRCSLCFRDATEMPYADAAKFAAELRGAGTIFPSSQLNYQLLKLLEH